MNWPLKMALRDARKMWGRLFFYISATSIGIGALVAAGLFRYNIDRAIQSQAKPLLGGDLVIQSRTPFSAEDLAFFKTLTYPKINEVELRTVAFFPKAQTGRLMEVRAVEPGFPYYGTVKTIPAGKMDQIFNHPNAVVDESILSEFNLSLGDTIQLGRSEFTIVGAVQLVPSESMASIFSSPKVFIDLKNLAQTGLIQNQSLARNRIYFKIENERELKNVLARVEPLDKERTWRARTVEDRRESLGRRAENTTRFLKLAALAALLLGGIGVASILTVYAKEKRPMAAVLRCMGASSNEIFQIFLAQGIFLGFLGSVLGTALGILFQAGLPILLRRTFEIDIPFVVAGYPVISGFAVGFCITVLFTLLPLLPLKDVSPLAALRDHYDQILKRRWSLGRIFVIGLLFLFVFGFSHHETSRPIFAAAVPVGIAVGYLLIGQLVRILMWILRKLVRPAWPYPLRQGLSNLYRPNNQTHMFVTALSIGSALIFMIGFLNASLLRNISLSTGGEEPTLALVDIQPHQREGINEILINHGASLIDAVPFVGMRLHKIKDELVRKIKDPSWAHRREYRSTYRNNLTRGENIKEGVWPPKESLPSELIPISIEDGITDELNVGMGDTIEFDVHGIIIPTVITAIRSVDWFQLRPNFFVVFPLGILDEAPQFLVMLARVASPEISGQIQRDARLAYPNVTIVDLRMVLETIQEYFGKVALALQVMALFVAATGFMILLSALLAGRYERLREAGLLRIIGAPSRLIRTIHFLEYGFIGILSGIFGLGLSLLGGFLLATYIFEIDFYVSPVFAVGGILAMVGLSTLTGLMMGRGLLTHSPARDL